MMLFFPSTIDTSLAKAKGLTLTPLFYTSDKVKLQMGRYDISPMQKTSQAEYKEGPYALAATLTGSFSSAFMGKEVPRGDSAAAPPITTKIVEKSPETRMVIVGDGHLAQDPYMSDPSNVNFLLNAADWLALDEALIQIRTKQIASRPLADISDGLRATIKYINIFVPAVLVIVIGLARWQMRRRRKSSEFTS
jgi:ABC-type uncharacterized transport system involved in gliding motility auxiliary subunit